MTTPVQQRTLMAWAPNSEEPEDIEMDPLFIALIFRLPKMGSEWPQAERDKWESMFRAIADGLHPESVSPEEDEGDNGAEEEPEPEQAGEEEPEPEVASEQARNDVGEVAEYRVDPEGAITVLPASSRKFHSVSPYANVCEASGTVIETIKRAGKPGSVWYNKVSGRIRVCADDHQGEDDEILVGRYGPKIKAARLLSDLNEVRAQCGRAA